MNIIITKNKKTVSQKAADMFVGDTPSTPEKCQQLSNLLHQSIGYTLSDMLLPVICSVEGEGDLVEAGTLFVYRVTKKTLFGKRVFVPLVFSVRSSDDPNRHVVPIVAGEFSLHNIVINIAWLNKRKFPDYYRFMRDVPRNVTIIPAMTKKQLSAALLAR